MNAVAPLQSLGSVFLDVPADVYHQRELGVASSSVLKMLLNKSPAHYRYWLDAEEQHETPSLAFGRAYHCRVLEPERFADEFLVMPSFGDLRSSTNRAQRDAWMAEHHGVTLLTLDEAERIEAMYAALMANPLAAGIMRQGRSEVTLYWEDQDANIRCKARADWWVEGRFFMDLKTTDDASPDGFARSVHKYGYHIQHAHYIDGAQACGETITNYLILAQEKEPPYVSAVYQIDSAAEIRGFELRQRAMSRMADCLRTNQWPGYTTGITELSLPAYALKD